MLKNTFLISFESLINLKTHTNPKSLISLKIRNLKVSSINLDKKPKVNVFEHLGDEQD